MTLPDRTGPPGAPASGSSFLERMRGGAALPARPAFAAVVRPTLGAMLAIGVVAYTAASSGLPLVLGSFGASCVLLFGFPDSPFSQPRNVVGGHFIATLTGLLFAHALGPAWWSMGLAAGCATGLMHLTRTVHPPAGSNPIIVMLTLPGWNFLLTPTLFGAAALVAIAVLFNNADSRTRYPRYWY